MKLVYKNILVNTIVSIIILFVGQYSLYFFLKNKIQKETIEHLYIECHVIKTQLSSGVNIEVFNHNIGDELKITPIEQVQYKNPIIKDVTVVEEYEENEESEEEHHGQFEEEHFTSKQIVFDVTQNDKNYRVSIVKTIDEDEGLAGSISAIIFLSGFFMLAILVTVNVLIYYKLFSPVYQLIKDVKGFTINQLKKINPPKTSTIEFIILGKEISKMSEKMILDYSSIKEFTENITHEIQTPLAVINSKIERCLQDKDLTSEQAVLLVEASKSVNKLFNINKGLTLLSRLDNKQFNNPIEINLADLIKHRVHYFLDFIENKNLIVTEEFLDEPVIQMKESLCEILIDNLLKNAIQHNIQNGKILITIHNNVLSISNPGIPPVEPIEKYFDRFHSQNPNQSLGLGLSIVKKIIEYYGYVISYAFENGLHKIVIDFNKKA